MSNVINFPFERLQDINDQDEIHLHEIIETIMMKMYEQSYDISARENDYESVLVYDAIKAYLFKMNDRKHPFQELAKILYEHAFMETDPRQHELTFPSE